MSNKDIKLELPQWIEYIQGLHPLEMELGLARVKSVYQALFPNGVSFKIISVAGTNGKGSTCELIAALLHEHGCKTGKFTSPHLVEFNERFQIERQDASDDVLKWAFAKVEKSRGTSKLTFFEFCFLIALVLFERHQVDIAILEVGLGGRLDAVNAVDADVSVLTSISFDHTEWLGNTLDAIGLEKIAIARKNKPNVLGVVDLPEQVSHYIEEHKILSYQIRKDFGFQLATQEKSWSYFNGNSDTCSLAQLPIPFNNSSVQLQNASVALKACELILNEPLIKEQCIRGLQSANLLGRCQVFSTSPLILIDVAHNEASVNELSLSLKKIAPNLKIHAVCAMLKDKQIKQCIQIMSDQVSYWSFVDIDNTRSISSDELKKIASEVYSHRQKRHNTEVKIDAGHSIESAVKKVIHCLNKKSDHQCDGVVVFGSFYLIGAIIPLLQNELPNIIK